MISGGVRDWPLIGQMITIPPYHWSGDMEKKVLIDWFHILMETGANKEETES